jgi:hypothetical protein
MASALTPVPQRVSVVLMTRHYARGAVLASLARAMADRTDLEFTYSLIDRIFRLSLGELADFSGA